MSQQAKIFLVNLTPKELAPCKISHICRCVFKKKANRNFRGNFLKNHFRYLEFYSNPPSWLARCRRCHMGNFWKAKDWSSHFWEGLSGFGTWKFTTKEDLNPRKQVFLFNLRLWPAQTPKIWSFFFRKKFIWEFCIVKARGFWFKN